MPRITARDGTGLYVKDWGSGRPVVLVHGWPLSADSWDDVALALAREGHRVVFYDRRGFGRSDQPFHGYDYDTLADDLAVVIDTLGLANPALVGFSMGGGEIARYLGRGGSARKVALLGSVVPYLLRDDSNPDGVPAAQFDSIKDGLKKDRPAFLASFFQQFYGIGFIAHPVSDEVLEWSRQVAMQAGLKGTLDCVDAFGKTDFRGDLPAFTMPTLVIHGTADKTVPIDVSGRAAAAAIPDASLIEYSGSPHGLLASDKPRIIEDLIAFLA